MPIYSIDLSPEFLGVDGKPQNPSRSLAKHLADILLTATQGPALKFHYIGVTLRDGDGIIDLDDADYKTVYDYVDTHPQWFATTKAQIMIRMEEDKRKPAKPKERNQKTGLQKA